MLKIQKWLFRIATVGLASLLASCGGAVDGNQSNRVSYSALVSFGDSLSDVGTYKVGSVAYWQGGRYTVNSTTDKNWTELLAAQLNLAAPCAAQTGLDGDPNLGFSVPVVNHAACLNYAQGGSRVSNPVGPANKNLAPHPSAVLGQLTVPVNTQMANHLAKVNGQYAGTELVTVMAGGNDVFMNLATVTADPATATAAVQNMGIAGAQLATLIKTQILDKGAKKVLVLNVPDVKNSPFGRDLSSSAQGLVDLMVSTFNDQLRQGLQGTAGVLLIDAYQANRDEVNNPSQYGLTNVTTTACNLTAPAPNQLGSSLVCTPNNLNAGDVSHYLFADTVHPTPYGYQLIAQLVVKQMVLAGWL